MACLSERSSAAISTNTPTRVVIRCTKIRLPSFVAVVVRADGCIVVFTLCAYVYVPNVLTCVRKVVLDSRQSGVELATHLGSGFAPSPSLRLCPLRWLIIEISLTSSSSPAEFLGYTLCADRFRESSKKARGEAPIRSGDWRGRDTCRVQNVKFETHLKPGIVSSLVR